MKRQSITGIAVLLLAGSLAAVSLRPEITGVNPPAPSPSKTSQSLVVSGREFAAGLSLSVTSPTGGVADYRGNAIAEQRETSFRVSAMLADAGTYRSWLEQTGLQVTAQQFVPEGSGGHELFWAHRPPG